MDNKWIKLGAVIAAATIVHGQAHASPTEVKLQATTDGTVVVQEVKGTAEYSYPGNNWKNLTSGKSLKAGATVRSSSKGAVTIRMDDANNFVRVSPSTSLQLVTSATNKPVSVSTEETTARVRSLRGKATVYDHGQWRQMKVNDKIQPGSTVKTGSNTNMDLFFPREGLVVRMKPQTVLSVKTQEQAASPAAPKLRLSVAKGGVELNHRTYLAEGK